MAERHRSQTGIHTEKGPRKNQSKTPEAFLLRKTAYLGHPEHVTTDAYSSQKAIVRSITHGVSARERS